MSNHPGPPGQVKRLFLTFAQVTDAGMINIAGLHQLTLLDLTFTKVGDAGLEHLKGLNQLTDLSLGGTRITDAGLENLKGLNRLESLGLDLTQVTDAGLESLKELSELRELSLGSPKLADLVPAFIEKLKQTKPSDLSRSKVTEEGVKKLRQAMPNCKIDFKAAEENPTPAAPEHGTPKADDPSGKSSAAKPETQVTPASDQPPTKEGSSTESTPAPANGSAAVPNTDQAKAIAEIGKLGDYSGTPTGYRDFSRSCSCNHLTHQLLLV